MELNRKKRENNSPTFVKTNSSFSTKILCSSLLFKPKGNLFPTFLLFDPSSTLDIYPTLANLIPLLNLPWHLIKCLLLKFLLQGRNPSCLGYPELENVKS